MDIPFTMHPEKKKIAAVGSALVDICLNESDEFVAATGAPKGGMTLKTQEEIKTIVSRSTQPPVIVPGGSACNTILGVGMLGGKACFIGKRGNDEFGELFEKGVRAHHIEPLLQTSDTPTGHVLSVITPDAQRSMFTFLGASAETDPAAITSDLFTDVALAHIEGYLLFNHDLIFATLDAAKKAGALISLDLAAFTVVEASKDILDDICENYVDILIANEDESRAFTGISDEQAALAALGQKADLAILKVGKRGSYITHGGEVVAVDRMGDGSAVDTTGAGDLWAAGFLYGLIHGYPLATCGKLGSACGYEVCQVIGAQIPEDGWRRIRNSI